MRPVVGRLAWLVVMAVLPAPGSVTAFQEDEQEVPLESLPPEVRRVVEGQREEGELRRVEREVENGKVLYEIELLVDGREREVEVDSSGRIVAVEEELDPELLPPRVRQGLVDLARGGRILEVESTSRDDHVTYEAILVEPGGRMRKVTVGPDGRRRASAIR